MTATHEVITLMHGVRAELAQRHRYAHSLRVARLAGRLARRHHEDVRRARLAGLLHDLARLYDAERLVSECESRGLPIEAFERRHPIVLHAPLGAALAQERFGIDDAAVLSAIARHTLAAPDMSALDTIVYLADSLEPGRSFPERAQFEALALRSLDDAMQAVLRSAIAHLRRHDREVAPATLTALTDNGACPTQF